MHLVRLDAVRSAITMLDATAASLQSIEIPRLIGRGAATRVADTLVREAAFQARDAVSLAEAAALPAASIDSARRAAGMLEQTPITVPTIRRAGQDLRLMAADLGAAEQGARLDADIARSGPDVLATQLLTREPDALSTDDWRLLARIADRHATDVQLPLTRRDAPPLGELATDIAAGRRALDGDARSYFDAVQVARLDPSALARQARELLAQPSRELDARSWERLAALLEDPRASAALPKLPARIGNQPFAGVARAIARGDDLVDSAVQAAFDEFQVAGLRSRQVTSQARALLTRHSSELEPHDWSRLAQLLARDADGSLIDVPRRIGNAKTLRNAALESADDGSVYVETQRYFDAYHARALGPEERTKAAAKLLARAPNELSSEDWGRLAAYLDLDPDATSIKGARELPGLPSFSKLARDAAERELDYWAVEPYFQSAYVATRPPEQLAAEAGRLIDRGVEEMTTNDWSRLAAIVDADAAGRIGIPRELPGAPSFNSVAWEEGPKIHAERYFEAARAARLSDAQVTAEAQALVGPGAGEIADADLLRLEALLRRDARGDLVAIPRSLPGEELSLQEVLAGVTTREGSFSVDPLRPYLEAARVDAMDDAERLAEARRLASLDGYSDEKLYGDNAERLLALVRRGTTGELGRLPRTLVGADPLEDLLLARLSGEQVDDATLLRYFDAWRAVDVPPAQRRAEVGAMLDGASGDLFREDWARLGALLDGDVERVIPADIHKLPRTRPLAQLAQELAIGERSVDAQVQRYFTAFGRTQAPEHRASLDRALAALHGGTATEDDLARIRAERGRVEDLADGRDAIDRAQLGAAMLGGTPAGSLEDIRAALVLIRDSRPRPSDMDPQLKPLLNRTTRLVNRNIQRIDGEIGDTYDNHVNYADMGRIRENVELVSRIRRAGVDLPQQGTSAPEVEAAVSASDDLLRW